VRNAYLTLNWFWSKSEKKNDMLQKKQKVKGKKIEKEKGPTRERET
jgi:hypothetical protein